MDIEKLINERNGTVQISDIDNRISFEAIEEIYDYIKPLLKKRRESGLIEGEIKEY